MNSPAATAAAVRPLERLADALEWGLTIGAAATLAWTTMCLGGVLAETQIWATRATWALAALGALVLLLRGQAPDWRALLPVPFLVFAGASVAWIAPAPWLAWREWLGWFQMWIWFALGLHFARRPAQAWTIFGTLFALALVGVALAAYQRFVDPKWMMLGRTQAEQFWWRSAGMFGVPNSLAALLELVLPFSLVWLASRAVSVTRKVFCAWLGAVFLFALVLTGSRGGWIGTAAALALWPLLASGRNWRRGLIGGLAVAAAGAAIFAVLYFASPAAKTRIDPFLRGEFESSRLLMWRVGVGLWERAPVLGTGAASYNVLFDQLRVRGHRHEPEWTHNDYLNTLSDYGLVGFVLWVGAGGGLMWLGWRRIQALRAENRAGLPILESARGRLGLWLGLFAFAVHLSVDFHTKIPALAWWFAWVLALMLRPARPAAAPRWAIAGVLTGVLAVVGWVAPRADAANRAEALRYEARWKIDRIATGKEALDQVVPWALLNLQRSVQIDPANGCAWGDYSYAVALSWHVTRMNARATGERAEAAARQALRLSPVVAENWVHLGVACDMQGRHEEAEAAFRRALELAPHTAEWHYYLAYHLAARPGRRDEALRSTQTCLDLDPSNTQAESLRARLAESR
jgi:O-antigen ligase